MKRVNPNLLKDAQVLLHSLRFRIIRALDSEPMNIIQLAGELKEKRSLVSYHLMTLLEHGFVRGKYKILKKPSEDVKGRAAMTHSLTSKVHSRLRELTEELADLGY